MLGYNDNFFVLSIQNSLMEESEIFQTKDLTVKKGKCNLDGKSQRIITEEDSGRDNSRYLPTES